MSMTGLDVFDRAVHRASEWLVDLASELGKDGDRPYAYRVLRSYLHLVRDRVTPEQAVDFASQLPLLLRGVFYDGWHPAGTPQNCRDAAIFVARLTEAAQLAGPTEASIVAETTTRVLRRRMSASQVDELLDALPEAIRRILQPQAPPAQAAAAVGSPQTLSAEDLPSELRSRVMAATGNAEVRVIERRGRVGNDTEDPGYEIYALAGDRFVHMVLRRRADGSVDETTETMLPEDIQGVDIEAQQAAVRDAAGRSVRVPASLAVAVGSLLATRWLNIPAVAG